MSWQPIETAPTDGTEVLGYRDDAGVFIMRYAAAVEFMTSREIDESDLSEDDLHDTDWWYADFIEGGLLDGDMAPTHWMPLPEPPETADA